MNNTAVIYARYSSHMQREESIEGQVRVCKDYAKHNGLVVVGEYLDRAVSGKTDQRPEFQRMIADSSKKQFDLVIVYTLDRFARNRYDSATYKAKLRANGVKVIYATQTVGDDPEGAFMESVLEGMAEYYSLNLARNVKRGLHESALEGVAIGQIPLGYTRDESRKLVIEPVGAEAIRLIYDMYLDGYSRQDIINVLNEKGYKSTRGGAFKYSSLDRILSNRVYIGEYHYSDVIVQGGVPAIISKQQFDEVQALIKKNHRVRARNKAEEEYLLTTKVFCGYCGAMLIGESGTSRNGSTYHYYKCATKKRRVAKCPKKTEKKNWLEETVVRFTVNQVLTDENIDLVATKTIEYIDEKLADESMLAALKARERDTNKKIENLMSAIEQGIITNSTKSRLQDLEDELATLKDQIAQEEVKKPRISKDAVVYWLTSFKNGDIKDVKYQRRIIDTLVNSIFVYDNDDGTRKIVFSFNLSATPSATLTCSDIEGNELRRMKTTG